MRVRFEPAPSGELHVGNVHTALFTWLYARHHGGTFVIRIADTDRERAKAENVETIYRDLRWLGIDWDEGPDIGGSFGPYLVSERADRHRAAVDKLLADGAAYRCYCTDEDMQARGVERGYDGHCRDAAAQERAFTVRLRMPDTDVVWRDEIKGDVRVPAEEVFDQRITRADGSPLYLLAVVCDDADMGITHIIRGADIISATTLHSVLFPALGAPTPKFIHLGLMMGPDGRKLGKRVNSMTMAAYRGEGYLAEAVVNYMALLGWSSPSQDEILPTQRIAREFDLDRVSPANVVFDQVKLRWLNQQHLMVLGHDELVARVLELYPEVPVGVLRAVVDADLLQSRVEVLSEIPDAIRYLHTALVAEPTDAPDVVKATIDTVEACQAWDAESIKDAIFEMFASRDINKRKGTKPLYVAISGAPSSLPLFDSMAIIGREETVRRLRAVL